MLKVLLEIFQCCVPCFNSKKKKYNKKVDTLPKKCYPITNLMFLSIIYFFVHFPSNEWEYKYRIHVPNFLYMLHTCNCNSFNQVTQGNYKDAAVQFLSIKSKYWILIDGGVSGHVFFPTEKYLNNNISMPYPTMTISLIHNIDFKVLMK